MQSNPLFPYYILLSNCLMWVEMYHLMRIRKMNFEFKIDFYDVLRD